MSFDLSQFFTRPDRVQTKFYNTYVVIALVAYVVITSQLLLSAFYYFSGNVNLISFPVLTICIWLLILALNKAGKHRWSVAIIALSVYFMAVGQIILFGWEAGFQYHLIALMAILMLYPHPNLKLPIIASIIILFSFIAVYYYMLDTKIVESSLNSSTHLINAVLSIIVISATNFYFRTNIAELVDRLNGSANTDLLTGLINRRGMSHELDRHCNLQDRMDHNNSLILIDIDHFKDINDTYGHSAGDAVLKQFALVLKKRLRETDLIGRWGGEEFLILTPFTDIVNASELAETLRKSVEETFFTYENQTIDIKITAGVTELIASKPIVDTLKRVDKLLYQGKTDGRNRVVSQAA